MNGEPEIMQDIWSGRGECELVWEYEGDGTVTKLIVKQAPPVSWVAKSYYDALVEGLGRPFMEAGEGLLVLHGSEETVRYRLAPDHDLSFVLDAYRMERIA